MNTIFISYKMDNGIDTVRLLQRDLQIRFDDITEKCIVRKIGNTRAISK